MSTGDGDDDGDGALGSVGGGDVGWAADWWHLKYKFDETTGGLGNLRVFRGGVQSSWSDSVSSSPPLSSVEAPWSEGT